MKIKRSLNTTLLIFLFFAVTSIFIPKTVNAFDFDDVANISAAISATVNTAANVTTATNATAGTVSDDVLDPIAIIAAKIAVKKITAATQKWVAGGFKNGEQLFVSSFKSFLREAGDQAIRAGLNELLTPLKEGAYEPKGVNELPLSLDDLPTWITTYIENTYNLDTYQKLQKFVTGIGHEQVGDWCDSDIKSCATSAKFKSAQISGCPQGNTWPLDYGCRMNLTKWTISVGLRNGDVLYFATSGFNNLAEAIPGTHGQGAGGGPLFTSLVPGQPLDSNHGSRGKAPSKPIDVGSYDRGDLNPFGKVITKSVVSSYHSTLAGTVENTMKEELGPQWLDFANDVTVGYNSLDPYSTFELLLKPGNNVVGTAYATGNRIANQADKALAASVTELTSPGFIADKTCKEEGEAEYADGTTEKICKLFSNKNPAGLIGDQVGASIKQSFDLSNVTKWEQVGIELLAEAADAVLTGGLEFAAGEIRNKTSSITAEIKQLGPLSFLFGKAGEALNVDDDDAWQRLASREIDFSIINFQINLTAKEALASHQTKQVLAELAEPTMVIDQECVLGPDFGWEQRLRENFKEDSEDLREQVQKDGEKDGDNDGLSKKKRARKNLLDYLQDELERQITWTKEAIESNPFPLQQQLFNRVNSIPKTLQQVEVYTEAAEAKQNAATTLSQIRSIIKGAGGNILLQKPPVWQDDIDSALQDVTELGSTGVGNEELSQEELLQNISNVDGGNSLTGLEGYPSITVHKPTLFLPIQEESYLFDVTEGVVAFDKEDGEITDDISISIYNDSLGSPITGTTTIDLSDMYEITPASGTTPAITSGMSYIVTYSVSDSDGNIATNRTRSITVKTYSDYLQDLSDFNKRFTGFLESIASSPLSVRSQLSRAVNLYLGIEKTISTESSLRDTEAVRERAKQQKEDLYNILDQCWLTLYQLDKLIDPKVPETGTPGVGVGKRYKIDDEPTIPGLIGSTNIIKSNPVDDGILAPAYSNAWDKLISSLEIREDVRIPYINRGLPYRVNRGKVDPKGKINVGEVITAPFKFSFNLIFDGGNNTSNLYKTFANSRTPDIRYASVPDFQCSLDAETLLAVNNACNQNGTCSKAVLNAYELYHCISTRRNLSPSMARTAVRTNSGGTTSSIRPAFEGGRHPIGVYGEAKFIQDAAGSPNPPTVADCNSQGTFPKSRILASPINNCSFWYGTLVHRLPPIPNHFYYNGATGTASTGLPYSQAGVTEFAKAWASTSTANYMWPVQLNAYFPSPTSTPKFWIEGIMHAIDVYGDHTRRTLYCNVGSILMNTLHDFNERWGVQKSGHKDNWWNGEFEADGITPSTSNIGGYKYWRDIQRCDDWTVSDLSTYTEFPKVDL